MSTDLTLLASAAATRCALEVARCLTDYTDDRIPTGLPADAAELTQAAGRLDHLTAEYASRAHEEVMTLLNDSLPYTMLRLSVQAGEIARMVLTYAQISTDDFLPAVAEAETLLTAVLMWRLANGETVGALEQISIGTAAFLSGQIAAETDTALDSAAWQSIAADHMVADGHEQFRSDMVIRVLAQDAYALGMHLLAAGDLDRARRWLTFAQIGPVGNATAILAEVADREPELRIDFEADPQQWRQRADHANRTARFLPADGVESTTEPNPEDAVTLPCVEIGGVQVYAYFHGKTGRLRVSATVDTAENWLLSPEGVVPLEFAVEGDTVYVV